MPNKPLYEARHQIGKMLNPVCGWVNLKEAAITL